jgi:hypothetical protein
VSSIIGYLAARVMELDLASTTEIGCRASPEQVHHGDFGRRIERAKGIQIEAGMSALSFGQLDGILHICHQLHELVIRVSTCCGEESAISPAITDRSDKWRGRIPEPIPKMIEVRWRANTQCLMKKFHRLSDHTLSPSSDTCMRAGWLLR